MSRADPVAEAAVGATLDVEYHEWLDRVRSTYRAVHYTCSHRLSDPRLAGHVAVQVAAGLVARPKVFRYFGLPYSGRIARLAEARLAEAEAGNLASVCEWSVLDDTLAQLPVEHREVLVSVCVRGDDLATLAHRLGVDEQLAATRRASTLAYMKDLATPGLAATADPDGED
jgi:DNA-directed RNA polymerase specialized sigma24 family protein